jgi:hypothetical protein
MAVAIAAERMLPADDRAIGKTRKQFFFEKKNQKTFALFGASQSFRPRQLIE